MPNRTRDIAKSCTATPSELHATNGLKATAAQQQKQIEALTAQRDGK